MLHQVDLIEAVLLALAVIWYLGYRVKLEGAIALRASCRLMLATFAERPTSVNDAIVHRLLVMSSWNFGPVMRVMLFITWPFTAYSIPCSLAEERRLLKLLTGGNPR